MYFVSVNCSLPQIFNFWQFILQCRVAILYSDIQNREVPEVGKISINIRQLLKQFSLKLVYRLHKKYIYYSTFRSFKDPL